MKKVLIYSLLLFAGLAASQLLPFWFGSNYVRFAPAIHIATMFCLSFIMIHVGYEFEINKGALRSYGLDYLVAATAAAFPWIFCALYFIFVMAPPDFWASWDAWKDALLISRFASPTSAGVLFSMLAAAGLAATWVFKKARVLAIFDDLDTVLLMIPLKMMIVGARWQLAIVALIMAAQLYVAWRFLHRIALSNRWPWVMFYSAVIVAICEALLILSKYVDPLVPIHIEVLLPAFVLGCIMARPTGEDPHRDDSIEGSEEGPEEPSEQRVSTVVSAAFMVLVGLSMPSFTADTLAKSLPATSTMAGHLRDLPWPGWGMIFAHVAAITVISNLGKMFPAFFYRTEASLRERIALAVAMFPRGEVGAGVLAISLAYGISGPVVTVAILSLAVNLVCTGLFIMAIKKIIA